jgi:hypothetical protein
MMQNPLPYPPQMRNGGLLPAHLHSSPHSNPVAAIVSNLKFVAAILSDLTSSLVAIAVSAKKALAEERHCHETATRKKALAVKANEQRQVAACKNALADEANKQRRATALEKALANNANKQ